MQLSFFFIADIILVGAKQLSTRSIFNENYASDFYLHFFKYCTYKQEQKVNDTRVQTNIKLTKNTNKQT
jgi:hypothetical protein